MKPGVLLLRIIDQLAKSDRAKGRDFIYDSMDLGKPRPGFHDIREALALGVKRGELRTGGKYYWLPRRPPEWGNGKKTLTRKKVSPKQTGFDF